MLKIAHELKRYLWQKLKLKKTWNVNKATTNKQVGSLVPKVGTTFVAIDNHMAIIQVQIGKNTIKDVFLDGGFGVNIITKQLRLKLRLPKSKHAPYNMRIYVHGIHYITTFTIFQNNVIDYSHSMLLGRPWLGMLKWHMIEKVTLLPY